MELNGNINSKRIEKLEILTRQLLKEVDRLKNVEKERKTMSNELENVKKEAKTMSNELENVKKEAKTMSNELENVKKEAKTMSNELENVKKEAKTMSNELENVKKEVRILKQMVQKKTRKQRMPKRKSQKRKAQPVAEPESKRFKTAVKQEPISEDVASSFNEISLNVSDDKTMRIRAHANYAPEEVRRGAILDIIEYFRTLVFHPNTEVKSLSIHLSSSPTSNAQFQEAFTFLVHSLGHQLNVENLNFSYDASEQKLIEILGALCPTRLRTLTLAAIGGANDNSDFGEVSKMEQWKNATSLKMGWTVHAVWNLETFAHFKNIDIFVTKIDLKLILDLGEFYKDSESVDRNVFIRDWSMDGEKIRKALRFELQREEKIKDGVYFQIGTGHVRFYTHEMKLK